jgi:hypothetical protein
MLFVKESYTHPVKSWKNKSGMEVRPNKILPSPSCVCVCVLFHNSSISCFLQATLGHIVCIQEKMYPIQFHIMVSVEFTCFWHVVLHGLVGRY